MRSASISSDSPGIVAQCVGGVWTVNAFVDGWPRMILAVTRSRWRAERCEAQIRAALDEAEKPESQVVELQT